jgi:hypothetical protein
MQPRAMAAWGIKLRIEGIRIMLRAGESTP